MRYETVEMLRNFTPNDLTIDFSTCQHFCTKGKLQGKALRGLFAAKSVTFKEIGREVDDEMLTRLRAETIIVGSDRCWQDLTRYFCAMVQYVDYIANTQVTRKGITSFIQQWLKKERVVQHVALLLPEKESKIGSSEFCRQLIEGLREFDKTAVSVELMPCNDNIKRQLRFIEAANGMIYSEPLVFRIDRADGKHLLMVVRDESEPRKQVPFDRYGRRLSPPIPQKSFNRMVEEFWPGHQNGWDPAVIEKPLMYSLAIEMFEDKY